MADKIGVIFVFSSNDTNAGSNFFPKLNYERLNKGPFFKKKSREIVSIDAFI